MRAVKPLKSQTVPRLLPSQRPLPRPIQLHPRLPKREPLTEREYYTYPHGNTSSAPTDGNHNGTNINITNGGSSGGDTHHGGSATNAFIWYYIGYVAQNSNGGGNYHTNNYYSGNVPGVGAPLRGGSDTIPNKGTVYQGLPSSGGSFTDSYRAARAKPACRTVKL